MATVPIALQVWLDHVFLTLRRPPLAIEKSSSSTFGPLATDAALAQNLRRLRERRFASALYRLCIGFVSALYRLCIGFISALCRHCIGVVSALHRLCMDFVSAWYRLCIGFVSALYQLCIGLSSTFAVDATPTQNLHRLRERRSLI